MKVITLSTLIFLLSCTSNQQKEVSTITDSVEKISRTANHDSIELCSNGKATDFLNLADKTIQTVFFHQLDSVRKVQHPKNDQDTAIFVDITRRLLDRFIKDVDKEQLHRLGEFEKEYNFNIAPSPYTDAEECKDKISLSFDRVTCSFQLTIYNEFFAEWCQESTVVYSFKIQGSKILEFRRNEAG